MCLPVHRKLPVLSESIGAGIGIGIAVEIGNRERFAIPKAIPIAAADC